MSSEAIGIRPAAARLNKRHPVATRSLRLAVAASALAAGSVFAQTPPAWPTRPITIVVALSPGAATDIEARMYAQKMTESLGRQVVVDYRPGAGSTIGTHHVVKSPPDGHNLIVMAPTFTFSNLSYPNLPYDPFKDIAPVSLMSRRPSIVLVHPSLPVKSVSELIALAKQHPGKLNVGTAGAGSFAELGWQWFAAITGIKFTIINYKGGAPTSAALMAGEVQVALGGITQMMPQVKSGKVRLIGVTTPERSNALPDVPTMAEQGAPGFAYEQWIGMGVTGATPAPIVSRLNAELVRAAKSPDVIARLQDDGTIIVASTPEAFRERIVTEAARWRKVAQVTGAKLAQ